ncbi:unnamed protein product [Phytophthora fragariaefolia]|uniref:Unnamed protein product n=1 Tax=Phytophthora fragariaefolia TaxID=1490495 RepID=A0A9W6XUV5_9STRA|nr:unnamed protein product [Phytophthora fragariaefolia]
MHTENCRSGNSNLSYCVFCSNFFEGLGGFLTVQTNLRPISRPVQFDRCMRSHRVAAGRLLVVGQSSKCNDGERNFTKPRYSYGVAVFIGPIAVHDPDDDSACSYCDHDLLKHGHERGQQQQHSHAADPRHRDPTSTDNTNNTQKPAIRETTIFTDGDSFRQSIKGSVPGFVLPSIDHQLQRHCCQERYVSEVC